MSVVGVEIPAGGLHRGVPENLLEHVQWDAGVGHPRCTRVAEPVTGEIGQAEVRDDLVPVRRIPHRRCRQHPAAWATQERIVGLLVGGEAFEDGFESVEDRHEARGVPWSA